MLRDRHLKVVSIWTSGANEKTDLDGPLPPPPRELWKNIVEEEAVKNIVSGK